MKVFAYHITWGTYGTRLHGDPRGTVDREHNEYGTPVLGVDEERWERERENLKFAPIVLTREQMVFIESIVPDTCSRGCWKYFTCAAGPDHVHVVLFSEHDPDTIRRLLKRWLGQALTKRFGIENGAAWWAECGSIRWVDSERYLKNVTRYVTDQRATPVVT